MKLKTIVILSIVGLVYACSPKVVSLSQADADRGAAKFKTTTLASLSEGKSIYELNCNKCHDLFKPERYSEAKWTKITPEMVSMRNKQAGSEVITPAQQELVLQYLVTMAIAPK